MNNILSIDLGQYAVKFLQYRVERKATQLVRYLESNIDEFKKGKAEFKDLQEVQLAIISDYIKAHSYDGKIHLIINNASLTYRFYHFPVKNLKKAQQMIPFQLDRDLLFSLKELHYSSTLVKQKNSTSATIHLVNLLTFEKFTKALDEKNIVVDKVSTELSVLECLIQHKMMDGNFAIIDIGHKNTNGYFFYQRRVVSNHLTFFGGSNIDEVIAETYSMTLEQASFFKENQGHILNDPSLPEVTQEQRLFSELMQKTFLPLIKEIERWLIHYQITLGAPIQQIFLIGGGSQLKNLDQFLAGHLSINVLPFSLFSPKDFGQKEIPPELSTSGCNLSALMICQQSKFIPNNLLFGRFSTTTDEGLPIYSGAFLGYRLLVLSLVIVFFYATENFFLYKKDQKINIVLNKVIRLKELGLLAKDQNKYQKFPEIPLKKLKDHNLAISRSIQKIKNEASHDALEPLVQMGRLLSKNEKIDLVKYEYHQGEALLTFKAEDVGSLNDFAKNIKELPVKIHLDEDIDQLQTTLIIKK